MDSILIVYIDRIYRIDLIFSIFSFQMKLKNISKDFINPVS